MLKREALRERTEGRSKVLKMWVVDHGFYQQLRSCNSVDFGVGAPAGVSSNALGTLHLHAVVLGRMIADGVRTTHTAQVNPAGPHA